MTGLTERELGAINGAGFNSREWNLNKLQVKEGSTFKSLPLKIVRLQGKGALRKGLTAFIALHKEECIAARPLEVDENKMFYLGYFEHREPDFGTSLKDFGVGSTLTAEAIEHARRKGAMSVSTYDIRNDAWGRHLVESLGGTPAISPYGSHVQWSSDDEYGRGKYREFLLREK
ncbi:MAG TPA: hypothetical protein VI875_04260 [Candidatus Norongarragalinales archaeon]|nr:hypothetical protein [Candidatus Norongarragalinales archaeon]